MSKLSKIKSAASSTASIIAVALLIAALFVIDKLIATGLLAIAVGVAVFLAIIDKDFRRSF